MGLRTVRYFQRPEGKQYRPEDSMSQWRLNLVYVDHAQLHKTQHLTGSPKVHFTRIINSVMVCVERPRSLMIELLSYIKQALEKCWGETGELNARCVKRTRGIGSAMPHDIIVIVELMRHRGLFTRARCSEDV